MLLKNSGTNKCGRRGWTKLVISVCGQVWCGPEADEIAFHLFQNRLPHHWQHMSSADWNHVYSLTRLWTHYICKISIPAIIAFLSPRNESPLRRAKFITSLSYYAKFATSMSCWPHSYRFYRNSPLLQSTLAVICISNKPYSITTGNLNPNLICLIWRSLLFLPHCHCNIF